MGKPHADKECEYAAHESGPMRTDAPEERPDVRQQRHWDEKDLPINSICPRSSEDQAIFTDLSGWFNCGIIAIARSGATKASRLMKTAGRRLLPRGSQSHEGNGRGMPKPGR